MRAARWLAIVLPLGACMAPAPTQAPTRSPTQAPTPAPVRARPVRPQAPTPAPTPVPMRRPTSAPPESGAASVDSGEPFELSLGNAVGVQGTGRRIRFASVEEDSRCPEGVQCISAGEARIFLDVYAAGGDRSDAVELSTARGSGEARVGGLTIRLLGLTPHPSSKQRINPGDYRARLVVGNP